MIRDIQGYCPMGCGRTLHCGENGIIVCLHPNCPAPGAAHNILDDPETEHVVTLTAFGYSMKHPLRERLDDQLLTCWVGQHIAEFGAQYLDGTMLGGTRIPPDIAHRVYEIGEGEDATTDWEPLP